MEKQTEFTCDVRNLLKPAHNTENQTNFFLPISVQQEKFHKNIIQCENSYKVCIYHGKNYITHMRLEK